MVFRQRELGGLDEELRAAATHAGEELAVRSFEEGILGVTLGEFGLEDDTGAVLVGKGDGLPDAAGHGVLRRGVAFGGDGRFAVLAEEVLHRVEEVLAHVAETALVEIPVTAEGTVRAMRMVRDQLGRTAVEVPVEVRRDGLGLEVRLTRPEVDLPGDAADRGETHRQRATEDAARDDATDLAGRADAVIVGAVEAEPGVHAERYAGLLHDTSQGDALADRTGQRLLAPDGFTAAGGHGRDDAVPMRRRTDMNDIGVRQGDDFTEVFRRQRRTAAGLLDALELLLHALGVDIANADDAVVARHAGLGVHLGDAATTDDDVVQGLAGRDEAAAEDVARDDREAKGGDSSLTQERTTG